MRSLALSPCPVPGCRSRAIPGLQLFCRWHWKHLPYPVRRELSNLHHNLPGSAADRAAIAAALAYLAERQPHGVHA